MSNLRRKSDETGASPRRCATPPGYFLSKDDVGQKEGPRGVIRRGPFVSF
jgi:hypothetical protein